MGMALVGDRKKGRRRESEARIKLKRFSAVFIKAVMDSGFLLLL